MKENTAKKEVEKAKQAASKSKQDPRRSFFGAFAKPLIITTTILTISFYSLKQAVANAYAFISKTGKGDSELMFDNKADKLSLDIKGKLLEKDKSFGPGKMTIKSFFGDSTKADVKPVSYTSRLEPDTVAPKSDEIIYNVPLNQIGKHIDESKAKITWTEDGVVTVRDGKRMAILEDSEGVFKRLANAKKINTTYDGKKVIYAFDGNTIHIIRPFVKSPQDWQWGEMKIASGTVYSDEGKYYVGDDGAVFLSESAYMVISPSNKTSYYTSSFNPRLGENIPNIKDYKLRREGTNIIIEPNGWGGYSLWLDLNGDGYSIEKPEGERSSGD